MEDNDKELMAELQEIADKEGNRIKPTDAISEGLLIFNNLITEFDKDLGELKSQLFIITRISAKQVRKALKNNKGKRIDNGQSTEDNKNADGGRVEMITDSVPADEMPDFLGDLESALVLSQWKEPQGILARAKYKGEHIQAMALGQILIFQKQLATGDKVTKAWNTQEDEAPERKDFNSTYEYKFLKNTFLHLASPKMLKSESPTSYEAVLDMIKTRLAKEIEDKNSPILGVMGDDDEEGDDDDD